MLIPQFSLRWLLAVITVCSFIFLIVSFAVRGHDWAVGVSVGILSLVIVAVVHSITFFMVWLFAVLTNRHKGNPSRNTLGSLLLVLMTNEAYAGGALHTLPTVGTPPPNGIVLQVDTTWPEGFGYRPITFTANCQPPATADRTLSFEFCFHDWNPSKIQLKVTTELDVPAGAATVSKTIAVPDFSVWRGYSLDTWEDGRHVPELSQKRLNAGGGFNPVNETTPAVLFVTAALPDLTQLAGLFPDPQTRFGNVAAVPPGTPAIPVGWDCKPPINLPDHWLFYQNLDVIFISLADLTGLSKNSPKVFAALREWTRAGGNLIVYRVGTDWKGLGELDGLFKETQSPGQSWKSPEPRHYSDSFTDIANSNTAQISEVDEQGNVVIKNTAGTPPADAPFRWRNLQQGAILAIAKDSPFANAMGTNTWYWMFNTLGSDRWLGVKRLGVNYADENTDFWNFLIPGVGLAPVDAFRVLITAFVVFIGPVNYYLLKKHGRLHLLLVSVPASALVVTIGLLAYALFSDGLHTRVRSRSVTLFDQRAQEATAWSRLAYYSGLAPSGGLQFDASTAVMPFEYHPSAAGGAQNLRVIDVEPDHQQLSRGWLPSRTPTQLMVVKPYVSPKKLTIRSGPNQSTVLDNQLGIHIHHLLVCDEQGKFAYGKNIPHGSNSTLETLAGQPEEPAADAGASGTLPPAKSLVGEMLKAFVEQGLAMPTGFTPEIRYGLFGFQQRMMYRGMGGQPVAVQQDTSRLESSLTNARRAVQQVDSSGTTALLGPRSYIAIVDRPNEVALGLDGATELDGFHVICGQW